MRQKILILFTLIPILVLGIIGCQPVSPTQTIDSIYTQSAQTMEGLLTQAAVPTTPVPEIPTATMTLEMNVPSPTPLSPSVSPTTATTSFCDWVSFIKDVSIPDGTFVEHNKTFIKTWQLKNRGTCTWTTSYALVFSNGSQMNGPVKMALPHEVGPGQTIDLSVTLTAPESTGNHRGYWMLSNASGVLFGFGEQANKAFYVDIESGPQPSVGFVSGKVCFPSEHIPPMTIFFQRLSDDHVTLISIQENQNAYNVRLDPGTYKAYAWVTDYAIGGAFTYSDQSDHRLKPFTVSSGIDVKHIDICDWYGGPGSVPLPPFVQGGIISGGLSYPSEFIPPLRIVAFNTSNGTYRWVDTNRDQKTFQITDLLPGTYNVVAYFREANSAAGFTSGRFCNLDDSCDHTLLSIEVKVNTNIIGVDPIDWYAPIGTFPPDPTT